MLATVEVVAMVATMEVVAMVATMIVPVVAIAPNPKP